jgi:hypothetical protein
VLKGIQYSVQTVILGEWFKLAKNGRTGEIRTRDQRIKSPLLYRLSYRPIFMALPKMIQDFVGLLAVKKETFGNV